MPRYKLTIEYDGSHFCGWQRQAEGIPTVQSSVEAALQSFTKETILVEGSGRTDQGVHATGQVAHFDLAKQYEPYRIQDALNYYLGKKSRKLERSQGQSISILKVEEVAPDFHARFSATARHYIYRITNRRSPLTFSDHAAWHVIAPLDVDLMNEAAQFLVGHNDFTSFRSIHCQAASPFRTLDHLSFSRNGEEITARAQSRSFLHNQVRIMVGSVKMVGEGRWPVQKIQETLDQKDRTKGGLTAPACGLYLSKVEY